MQPVRGAMFLARKILARWDGITRPADTYKQLHISTAFLGLAGGGGIGVPHNHGRAGSFVLLDSPGAERFKTIERVLV